MSKKGRLIMTIALCAALLIVLAAGSLKAKDDPCRADIEKFCKGVKPGQGRITNCLKQHESELSKECTAYRTDKGKEQKKNVDAVRQACDKDVERFCKGVPPGQGRIAKCLKDHTAQLSPECKAFYGK
jgi:hypothetical protein